MCKFITTILLLLILSGCHSVPVKTSDDDVNSDLRGIAQQVQKDKEARSAVQAVAGSISGRSVKVKYCPVDGQRFSGDVERCPKHNVKLEPVEE